MKSRHVCIVASLLGIISLATVAEAKGVSTPDFVKNASIANKFEIDSSQLALEKSQNSDVKNFAKNMVDDHSKTGDKMKEVLASTDTKVKPADTLDKKHQKLMNKLQSVSGNHFDRQYITIQTDAHKEAVSLFDDYSKNGKDAKLKDFASETLPTLKKHLEHVQQLKAAQ